MTAFTLPTKSAEEGPSRTALVSFTRASSKLLASLVFADHSIFSTPSSIMKRLAMQSTTLYRNDLGVSIKKNVARTTFRFVWPKPSPNHVIRIPPAIEPVDVHPNGPPTKTWTLRAGRSYRMYIVVKGRCLLLP